MRATLLAAALVLALVSPASAQETAPAPAPAAAGNEIEALVRARKFDRAIARVDELRAAAGASHVADAESEYWGGKAAQALGANDDARARLRQVAKLHASSPRAADAAIEAAMIGIDVPKGHTSDKTARSAAAAAAGELEALAPSFANPGSVARAWFTAGNAWRIAEDDKKARADYEKALAVGVGDYPMKARHMLGILAGRDLDPERSRALLGECVAQSTEGQQERCRKDLAKLGGVGSPAPPLAVETWINGEPQTIEGLRGKVVLIWFFGTWCPHCKSMMPEMATLVGRLKGKPFQVIALTSNEEGQTTESAKVFVSDPKWAMTYPVGVDKAGSTAAAYNASAVPSAVLIDKKGVVRWAQHPGYLSDGLIDALIAE